MKNQELRNVRGSIDYGGKNAIIRNFISKTLKETFEKQGYILALKDFEDLEKLIKKEFTPKEFITNNNNFNEKLYNKIYLGK